MKTAAWLKALKEEDQQSSWTRGHNESDSLRRKTANVGWEHQTTTAALNENVQKTWRRSLSWTFSSPQKTLMLYSCVPLSGAGCYSKWWAAPIKGDTRHPAKCQGQVSLLCEEEPAVRTCGEVDISGARGEQSTANTSRLLFFHRHGTTKKQNTYILEVYIIFCFQTEVREHLVDANNV